MARFLTFNDRDGISQIINITDISSVFRSGQYIYFHLISASNKITFPFETADEALLFMNELAENLTIKD